MRGLPYCVPVQIIGHCGPDRGYSDVRTGGRVLGQRVQQRHDGLVHFGSLHFGQFRDFGLRLGRHFVHIPWSCKFMAFHLCVSHQSVRLISLAGNCYCFIAGRH